MFNKILIATISILIASSVISGIGYGFHIEGCLAKDRSEIEQLQKAIIKLSTVPGTLKRIDMRTRVMAERQGIDVDKLEGK